MLVQGKLPPWERPDSAGKATAKSYGDVAVSKHGTAVGPGRSAKQLAE